MPNKMKSPIEPLGEYILVAPNSGEEVTKSGIYNAGNGTKDRTESIAIRGYVVALPIGYKVTSRLSIGDEVYVAKWEAQKVKFNTKEYILVKEKDILGKLL